MPLDQTRILLLVILALPLAAAVAVASRAARTLRVPVASQTTFQPEFVPGDPGRHTKSGLTETHATAWDLMPVGPTGKDGKTPQIQFYVGLDGLNIWLIV